MWSPLPKWTLTVRISASGDTAVIVEFGNKVDRNLSSLVLRAATVLSNSKLTGVLEVIPTFRSLMVQYDPLVTTSTQVVAQITPLMSTTGKDRTQVQKWSIPVCYEEEFAADIAEIAAATGQTIEQVIELHSGISYHVYMLGFLPGFPYLGDLVQTLHLPRRTNPRTRVPKGSISIATSLTSIYPFESPGGWHLIGTTPVELFDLNNTPPALLCPGDQIRFEAISRSEFIDISKQVSAGKYSLEPVKVTI